MSNVGLLSVIIPAYNEESMIETAQHTIEKILSDAEIPYELVFVDDGSKDGTWSLIAAAAARSSATRGLRFSRNFGKEAAITSGLTASCGDCCVVIDCDLQHPPEKIVEMYRLWEQGYEVVEGRKSSRGTEKKLYTAAAKIFYSAMSAATGYDMANASDFKLLDRKAVDALINMKERSAFFRALSSWIGFKSTCIEYDVQERKAGSSKWSTFALMKYAVKNILSFTTAPMQIVTILGAVMFAVAIIFGAISLIQKILGQALEGFTTVILLQLFSSSIVMLSLGIVGQYIAKIYEEVKGRPRYIVAETCGEGSNESQIK